MYARSHWRSAESRRNHLKGSTPRLSVLTLQCSHHWVTFKPRNLFGSGYLMTFLPLKTYAYSVIKVKTEKERNHQMIFILKVSFPYIWYIFCKIWIIFKDFFKKCRNFTITSFVSSAYLRLNSNLTSSSLEAFTLSDLPIRRAVSPFQCFSNLTRPTLNFSNLPVKKHRLIRGNSEMSHIISSTKLDRGDRG